MYKHVQLETDYQHFLSYEIPEGSSCIKRHLTGIKDIHEKFANGFPKTFGLSNTIIHQKFWDRHECDYEELGKKLGLEVVSVSTITQPPGMINPLHRDTFYQIKIKYPENSRKIVRCNIYLEDWKLGHFLQYEDKVDVHWKQGDGHMWDSERLHLSANAGMENKPTLQVSGFLL
jgi:hypothetical protein